jgi:16S rRNA processing protein RimM
MSATNIPESRDEEFILVGKIEGVFGVKGWVKIFSFTEPRQRILEYSPLFLKKKGQWIEAKITGGKKQGKSVVLALEGITDRDLALSQVGTELAIQRKQLKPTGKDEYYWSSLIGLSVVNLQDEEFGEVIELLETGANDVLVVKAKQGKESVERLIPFVLDEIVKNVDLDAQLIRVDWDSDY